MKRKIPALALACCAVLAAAAADVDIRASVARSADKVVGCREKEDVTVVPKEFKEKVAQSRNWTQRTNPLFALSAEGVDDIHLAYEGESAPVLVLSNKTAEVLSLRGAVRISGFGGTSFSLEASGDLAPYGCRWGGRSRRGRGSQKQRLRRRRQTWRSASAPTRRGRLPSISSTTGGNFCRRTDT